MKIEVTQEDIERGSRRSCCLCPLARAIERALQSAARPLFASVGLREVEITTQGGARWCYARLPAIATEFVRRFDAGFRPVPFSFELDLPVEAARGHGC